MSRQTTYGDGGKLAGASLIAAALTSVTQPVWVLDPDGLIRLANPAAAAMLGYPDSGALLGRNGHETVHADCLDTEPHPASECPLLRPCTTGDTVTSELDRFVRRDGSPLPVSYVSAPLELPGGRGAVLAFTDIEDRRLAGEQAALRRVASLVAGGAASDDVFAAVAREVANVLGLPLVVMSRFERDEHATVIGAWADRPTPFQPGTRWPLDGPTVSERVFRTGRPVRIDYENVPGRIGSAAREAGMSSGAGAPIIVDGQVWGAVTEPEHSSARSGPLRWVVAWRLRPVECLLG